MNNNFFKSVSKDTKVKKDKTTATVINVDPVLFSNSDSPEIIFVIDKLIGKTFINTFIDKVLNKIRYNIKFKMLYCFNKKPLEKDLKSNIGNYFWENSIDIEKYIPRNSKVITIGRGLYSLCDGNTDILVKAFYDTEFNQPYFYNPKVQSYVWPTDDLFNWLEKDTFDRYFALGQIKRALEYNIVNERQTLINKIWIENTDKFLLDNMDPKEVSWDIETSGFNFLTDKIGCITMSFDGRTGYFLEWEKINKELLNKFFENKYQILSSGKFDCKFLRQQGVTNTKIDFDCHNAGHVLNEMRSNSLKTHAWLYTKHGGYETDLDKFKKKNRNLKNYLEIPKDILWQYATMDAIVSFQAYKKMKNQIETISNNPKYRYVDMKGKVSNWTLRDYYYKIVIPAVNTFIDIEMEGVYFDWEGLKKLEVRVTKEINELKSKICKSFDLDASFFDYMNESDSKSNTLFKAKRIKKSKFNIDSNSQLGKLLESKGWTCYGRTKPHLAPTLSQEKKLEILKKAPYLVNDETLGKWIKEGHEEAKDILKLHKLNTIFNAFIVGYWKYRGVDDRLHPNFGVMLTNSGRNRCSNPNLQNTVERGYLAKELKALFITKNSDYIDYSIDYSGLQLHVGCIFSYDKFMTQVFKSKNDDIHSLTALETYGNLFPKTDLTFEELLELKKQEPYADYRQKSKTQNFQLEFGASSFNFAKTVIAPDWPMSDCIKYIQKNNLESKRVKLLSMLYGENQDNSNTGMFDSISNKEEFSFFWCVAADVRKKHFELYSGLKNWIDQTIKLAEKQGYIISVHGAIRRLPQLNFTGKQDKQSSIKNLKNISLNTAVQNFEISLVHLSTIEITKWFKDNNIDARPYNTIHDSEKFYIHKDYFEICQKKIKEVFEQERPEFNGIPMPVEGKVKK